MSEQIAAPLQSASRSLGLKLMVILALIVLMAVPVMFISLISFDRSSRADDVTREVSQTYGGAQRLLGPVVIIPYRETLADGSLREGDYVVSATSGSVIFDGVDVEEKRRSLYSVAVYNADARLSAVLPDLKAVAEQANLSLDLGGAHIVVGLSDVTGLQSDVSLQANGQSFVFEPYSNSTRFNASRSYGHDDVLIDPVIVQASALTSPRGIQRDRLNAGDLTLMSVSAGELLQTGDTLVEVTMNFTGAKTLSVLPFAKSTTMGMASDWPHPGFDGRFPPNEREIVEAGFTADWSVPFLRRGVAAEGRAMNMQGLTQGRMGDMQVNFVSPVNPYQTVNRALKYAVLFIGLVFLAYFLMETLLGVRVHPAQYLLIGVAQAVFYLLLLAFAEQIGFTLAFAFSATATVALTAGYAGAVFGKGLIWKSALVFGSVYGLLFVLMRIQDFALMVGALVSFIAVAATLYLTRNMNWYGTGIDGAQ